MIKNEYHLQLTHMILFHFSSCCLSLRVDFCLVEVLRQSWVLQSKLNFSFWSLKLLKEHPGAVSLPDLLGLGPKEFHPFTSFRTFKFPYLLHVPQFSCVSRHRLLSGPILWPSECISCCLTVPNIWLLSSPEVVHPVSSWHPSLFFWWRLFFLSPLLQYHDLFKLINLQVFSPFIFLLH